MLHDTPLISTIVAGLVLAFIFGSIAHRFRMPPLVGYIVAGVLVGPFTPGFVADQEMALELSEIGVILLMFGVGLHFSLKDLLSVRAITIPGALVQIGGGTLMGLGLALMMGWSLGAGIIFGLALSVASTVVLLKAMQDHRLIESERGRIAVGWLIVEDIAMVLALVAIPAIAALTGASDAAINDPFVRFVERLLNVELGIAGVLAITVVKLVAFVGFMLVVGRRIIPAILHVTAHSGSRELFRLAVLAIALGVAAGAAFLFGVSLALGAFFAGMILSESQLSQRAAQESLPLRDAFAVLFFVAVGMLFDPSIIITDPLPVLATLFIIIVGKSALAFLIVVAFGRPASTALTISASLAQIGEFSFILATLGIALNILPVEARDFIVAGAILSIVLNPVAFWGAERARPYFEARAKARHAGEAGAAGPVEPEFGVAPAAAPLEAAEGAGEVEEVEPTVHPTALTGHSILIGFGRVGSVIAEGLKRTGLPFLLIEDAETRVRVAREEGIEVIVGNAASSEVLGLANVEGASAVLIAIPNAFEAGQATERARKLNPAARIIARAHSDEEEEHLKHLGADEVIMGEREIALGMLGWLEQGPAAEPPAPKLEPASNIIRAAQTETAAGSMTDEEAALEAASKVVPVPVPPVGETLVVDDLGPAEPPADVPAFGEMPDEPEGPAEPSEPDEPAEPGKPEVPPPSEPQEPVPGPATPEVPPTPEPEPAIPVPPEPTPLIPEVPPAPMPGTPGVPEVPPVPIPATPAIPEVPPTPIPGVPPTFPQEEPAIPFAPEIPPPVPEVPPAPVPRAAAEPANAEAASEEDEIAQGEVEGIVPPEPPIEEQEEQAAEMDEEGRAPPVVPEPKRL